MNDLEKKVIVNIAVQMFAGGDGYIKACKNAACELDGTLENIVSCLDSVEFDLPAEIAEHKIGIFTWYRILQQIITDILYFSKEKGVPYLKELAFKNYDFCFDYQATAIEHLCRMANEGLIEKESLISEIECHIPDFFKDTLMDALYHLSVFSCNEHVLNIYDRLLKKACECLNCDPTDALQILRDIAICDTERAKQYISISEQTAANENLDTAIRYKAASLGNRIDPCNKNLAEYLDRLKCKCICDL